MPNQPKTPARSVRVGDSLWNAVKDKAAERGETVTDVIVQALEQYVKVSEVGAVGRVDLRRVLDGTERCGAP